MSRLCDVFWDIEADQKAMGAYYTNNNYFIVEINIDDKSITDKILSQNAIYVTKENNHFTFYDLDHIQTTITDKKMNLKIFAKKCLDGIISYYIEEDSIKYISFSIEEIHNLFQDSSIDVDFSGDKSEIIFKTNEIYSRLNEFDLNINLKPIQQYSHDSFNLSTITDFEFKYKKPKPLVDVIGDIKTLQYFLSYTSNKRFSYKIIKIINESDDEYVLKNAHIHEKNTKGLFVPDHNMVHNFSNIFSKIFDINSSMKDVLKTFWDASKGTVESQESLFKKWIKSFESLYSSIYNNKPSKKYTKTLKDIKEVIADSDELKDEQKNIAKNRLHGLIDNPLRKKIVTLLKDSNGLFYKINPRFLETSSDFINKIINTRNKLTHPENDYKETFDRSEIRQANAFFKCATFIVVSKWLDIDFSSFRGYYYEKPEFFFNLIGFSPT